MSIILLELPRPKNPNRFEDVVNAPLSACLFTGYIASVLRENKIKAEIINAHLYDWSIEQTITNLTKNPFQLLCVHTVYLWEKTQDIFDMLFTLKTMNLTAHINLYGYYPTFAYKKILEDFPHIDSVTIGEPEFTALELAQHISQNRALDEIHILGLASRNNQENVVFSPRPPVQNLDQLPYPDRRDIDLYKKKGIVTYIQGSRGCYGHCTFCYLNPFYGQVNLWRGRSAKNIFEEILKLHREHSVENFYFSDANFFGPAKPGKERAVTLAELILAHDLDIRFGFECRANDIEEYSLSRLVMAGLTNVFLGLESGDPASLKRFKKHTTVDENIQAIQLLRDYGIEPTFGFIMFEPNSTLESVRNNFEFLQEMGIMTNPAVTAHLLHHRQTIFAGTPDYQSMTREATCTDTSFKNYELFYKIKDPKVEAFSEIISNVCRSALSLLPKTFTCESNASKTGFESNLFDTLNNTLIAIFAKTLSDFDANRNLDNPDAIRDTSQKLAQAVETVFGKQSVVSD
ncbi:MAG TPA: B12-binding domain-containing radical SAM protein [Candidatus Wunengus sp. YC63]|uniref:B12-binding domain-containing radical SAM protein n=1 Tax=Candidatus Wunengus sp. YC63 TaxID=3367699 RepID=UPI002713BB9B|nr:radical SAM protein [Candidatus Brocadiales bacterium]